jgi:hypothetical protein
LGWNLSGWRWFHRRDLSLVVAAFDDVVRGGRGVFLAVRNAEQFGLKLFPRIVVV